MKRILLMITLVSIASSCGLNKEKSQLSYFKVEANDFTKYINQKPMPSEPNLSEDKAIINNDYPFEIALYSDGRWFYNLPNLDTGSGTWKFENGELKLFASRTLFDMKIDIKALEEEAARVALKFSDRFGPQVLKMENVNIQND